MSKYRYGEWANSATGRQFWPNDPRPDDVCIEDIARALSRICRFGGHLRSGVEHYSVAQHSVLVSLVCPPEYALHGLMHDAEEAYIGDPIKPIHQLLGRAFWQAKWDWQTSIALHVGLPQHALRAHPIEIKRADMIVLATERRDLCEHRNRDWELGIEPLADTIVPMRSFDAYDAFLLRYAELKEVAP